MKKVLLKDSLKEIKNTYKRFISILLMAFLGVGFFAGIRATSPDMVNTIDKYYDDQNVYDIHVLSTLGLTEEDIKELEKIENIEIVQGSYEKDGKIEIENNEIIAKIIAIDELNIPVVLDGRMPENQNECLVENSFLQSNNKNIGDKIKLEVEDITNDEGEDVKYLKDNEVTIVGTVQSPLYISRDRGTSNLGAGKINYYIYISKDNINMADIYTSIYIQLQNSKSYTTSSDKYEEYVDKVKDSIEEIKETREQARYDELVGKAQSKVDDAEKELNDQKEEAQKEIDDAEKKIKDGKQELKDAEEKINSQEKTANSKFAKAEKDIENAKKEINEKETLLKTQIDTLNNNKNSIEQGIDEIDKGIVEAQEEINSAKKKIEDSKKTIAEKESQLKSSKKTTYNKIEKAKTEIKNSKKELEDAEKELNENKKEFEEKISDVEKKLADAKEEILEIENPTWYVLDRNANSGYVSFIQDSDSIANIGKVFPIVFFIVATLISLTSMTRMVEEQRMQIGTLKALGYNSAQITMKYVLYASLACIIGGTLGMCVGFTLLPKIIWMMYGMMYQMTDVCISFNVKYGAWGLGLISICIIGATIYTVLKELMNMPAVLMRPKAPKSGNRVLLEKIPFIWKRLNFSQKVTIRNIFRYKKRFFMTIIGIFGCTSLILAGFGLKDSVTRIIPNQFGKVFTYDIQINLKDSISKSEKEEFINELKQNDKTYKLASTYMISGSVINNSKSEDVQIIVPEDENGLDEIINIKDIESNEKVNLEENKICLTDKAAQLLDVKVGDTVTIKDNDDVEIQVQVSNIVENYIQHYVFMSRQTYENIYNQDYEINSLLVNTNNLSSGEKDDLAREIMKKAEVASVSNISSFAQTIEDMMSLLNYVVIVLIVSAGLLAFVVLYNLSNVNISERIRELATIKVLGFYDKEVYDYVTRETIILTVIGIALGLIGGYLLNYYILGTCEINILRFSKYISPMSYVYAVAITIVFTVIVNIATYLALKKINMIESLKSVE